MTYRLVGLMSLVLLLSLAAFGLLMNHYHDQVMAELTQTVSDAGRAALNSFGFGPGALHGDPLHAGADGHGTRVIRVVGDEAGEAREAREAGENVFFFTRTWTSAEEDGERKVRKEMRTLDGSWVYQVSVDAVQAEKDPAANSIVLRIPTVRTSADGGGTVDDVAVVDLRAPAHPLREEIRLPISTSDYGDLFADARRRSMWLALGVFAVGTALSAGLASRFTRPIRKLDAGIHRISGGDLDVEVDVEGSAEIGRLATGFNEMTRELRAGRDRVRELTRREKLSALGRLAAGVAHEVRNPLHSINLTLQHLEETARPDAAEKAGEFDRSLGIIKEEIGRLDQVVGNFLRFAKTDSLERRPVGLDAVVDETVRLVRKEAEWRNVKVKVESAGHVPAVEVNLETLRSSLLNLVLNSFEAMPDGGSVTLRLSAADGEVRLEVIDDGEGIPEDEQERVFEFAYTTKDGGNGLGLAMVHQCVVEEHGGRIALDSRPGEGTRVLLAFPEIGA